MSVPETGGEKPPQAPYINDSRRPTVPMSAEELLAAQRKLKFRNAITGLLIGSFALGIYFYTFHAISQETFLDDLEAEAKALRAKAAQASGTET